MHLVLPSIFVAFLWSMGAIFQKYALHSISPTSLMCFSGTIYATCILIYFIINKDHVMHEASKLTTKTISAIAAFTILSMFFSIILFYHLLKHNDAYKVNSLTYIAPLFTLALAILFLGESPRLPHILGVVLIVLGVALVGAH